MPADWSEEAMARTFYEALNPGEGWGRTGYEAPGIADRYRKAARQCLALLLQGVPEGQAMLAAEWIEQNHPSDAAAAHIAGLLRLSAIPARGE